MPDLNSVPPSPHILAASRRTSSIPNSQNPQNPQNPSASQHPTPSSANSRSSSINILPSNQPTVNQGLSGTSLPSPSIPSFPGMAQPPSSSSQGQDNTGVGAGPGPLRHPRPLTAAELHSQLEQEQELLVNRLTRDLTLLRAAHNSSVVSNASSTSNSTTADQSQHGPSSFTDTHLMSGPGFPIPTSASTGRQHHRTSSSTSARSQTAQSGGVAGAGPAPTSAGTATAPISIPQPHSGSAASVLEAARNPRGFSLSRQNSAASMSRRGSDRSRNNSPQPFGQPSYGSYHGGVDFVGGGSSSYFPRSVGGAAAYPSHHHHQQHQHPHQHQHQHQHHSSTSIHNVPSSATSTTAAAATPGSSSELSPGLVPATLRYEETAQSRAELEAAKRENDALKRRVKDLERLVRDRHRDRSESVSTSASVLTGAGAGAGAGAGVGVPDDEVRVGESAASAGLSSRNAAAIAAAAAPAATPSQSQAR